MPKAVNASISSLIEAADRPIIRLSAIIMQAAHRGGTANEVVLVQNVIGPYAGLWSLPGGELRPALGILPSIRLILAKQLGVQLAHYADPLPCVTSIASLVGDHARTPLLELFYRVGTDKPLKERRRAPRVGPHEEIRTFRSCTPQMLLRMQRARERFAPGCLAALGSLGWDVDEGELTRPADRSTELWHALLVPPTLPPVSPRRRPRRS